LPDATASVVYGMYDLFRSAGRDWGTILHGQPGPAVLDPSIVATKHGPLELANGVTISPNASLEPPGARDLARASDHGPLHD
jgi:hypothetical protein